MHQNSLLSITSLYTHTYVYVKKIARIGFLYYMKSFVEFPTTDWFSGFLKSNLKNAIPR